MCAWPSIACRNPPSPRWAVSPPGRGPTWRSAAALVWPPAAARLPDIFARGAPTTAAGGWCLPPRLIGLHRAKELAFFADIISAKEAEAFGLVNRVVPAGELDAFVDDWAARLAAGPPIALAQTKDLLNNSFDVTLAQALEDEAKAQTVNGATADPAEAVRPFLEKRPPNFEGRWGRPHAAGARADGPDGVDGTRRRRGGDARRRVAGRRGRVTRQRPEPWPHHACRRRHDRGAHHH